MSFNVNLGIRAHDYGRHSLDEAADVIEKAGFKYIQLALPRTFIEVENFDSIDRSFLEKVRRKFDEKGFKVAIFSCYQDLSNPDEEIRKKAVASFIKCLDLNVILGAQVVGTETSYDHLTKLDKNNRFPYMIDSLKRIAEAAERLNQDFAIEPVAWHPLSDVETAVEVLDLLGSGHGRIIFDLANVLEKPDLVQQTPYWKHCFNLLGDRISTIHLKDFIVDENGNYFPRLLGEGCMDYGVLREFLKKNPHIPVIREELDPTYADREKIFIENYFL
ncbi:MAG: sugar phosphate isomerase/epimerase [Eubacterium sp.]|nr:sugar phosphate isomerase/epimerase [Eubacterium sp.]